MLYPSTGDKIKTAIVTAVHIQPTQRWVDALLVLNKEVDIIVVDDSNGKVQLPERFEMFDYAKQEYFLGEKLYKYFIQFQHSSACKNFGTWLAYKRGYDPIIVIDSDCIVSNGFVENHEWALEQIGDGWANPLEGTGCYSRGFPYHLRRMPLWANMGLWENELDLYGLDRLAMSVAPSRQPKFDVNVVAQPFPLSGMNVAFRREAIPYMLFLPSVSTISGDRFSRHDDIWGGYIFQKAAFAHGRMCRYGRPWVFHETEVDAKADAEEEVSMLKYEQEYYEFIDKALGGADWSERPAARSMAVDLFQHLCRESYKTPFRCFADAFLFWANVFEK